MAERFSCKENDSNNIGVFEQYHADSSSGVDMRIGYRIKLLVPSVDLTSDDKIIYTESDHIFTLNEIDRSIQRYYIDLDEVEPGAYGSDGKLVVGYANPRTYMNKSFQKTTRFVVRFKTNDVGELRDGLHFGLFTAREMSRSMERVQWLHKRRRTWLSRLLHWIRN